MGRLLKAIGGVFATILNLVTFGLLDIRKWLVNSPTGIKAEFTAIIDEKRSRANAIKDATGQLVANNEKKKARLEELIADCKKLEQKKEGAFRLLRKRMDAIGDPEKAKEDSEVQRLRAAYKDYGSTLKEKEEHCDELEVDIEEAEKQIQNFEIQVKSLSRELAKLQDEKSLTVAEVQAAKEAKAAADAISGLSEDNTADRLEDLRNMRRKAKADVKVSERVSGMDAKVDDEEFLAAAAGSELDDELDSLLAAASDAEGGKKEQPAAATTELPE